jgi:hypothetical protein
MRTVADKKRAGVIAAQKYFATAKGKAARHRSRLKNGPRNAKRLRVARRAFLSELKSRPCGDCGGSFPSVCMDFDHRPGETKLLAIGTSITSNIEALKREVAKCDVVCANCHRIRTHKRRDHLNPGKGPSPQLEFAELRSA